MKCVNLGLAIALIVAVGCATPKQGQRGEAGEASAELKPLDPKIAERIANLFQTLVVSRHGSEGAGVKRASFLKTHGCLKGQIKVEDGLGEVYRKGFFTESQTKNIVVRISSDTNLETADSSGGGVGIGVKIIGVSGEKASQHEADALTQDFLLQNHPVYFVDTAQDFLEYSEATFIEKEARYLAKHSKTKDILAAMKSSVVENALSSTYWSAMPYKFGEIDFAKYKVVPCVQRAPEAPTQDPNYLNSRLQRDLKKGACFHLQVQLRKSEEMPLDAATVEWSELQSPPQTVAVLRFPPQDIARNAKICESLSFQPWHALQAHRPVGSINEAREIIYRKLSLERRSRNGVPIVEPSK